MGNRALLLCGVGAMLALLLAIGAVTALAPPAPARLAALPQQRAQPAAIPQAGVDGWVMQPVRSAAVAKGPAPAREAGLWSTPAEFAPPE